MDCARKTIAQDGARALWKGFGPAMARVSKLVTPQTPFLLIAWVTGIPSECRNIRK